MGDVITAVDGVACFVPDIVETRPQNKYMFSLVRRKGCIPLSEGRSNVVSSVTTQREEPRAEPHTACSVQRAASSMLHTARRLERSALRLDDEHSASLSLHPDSFTGVTVQPCVSALNRIKREASAFEVNLAGAQVAGNKDRRNCSILDCIGLVAAFMTLAVPNGCSSNAAPVYRFLAVCYVT